MARKKIQTVAAAEAAVPEQAAESSGTEQAPPAPAKESVQPEQPAPAPQPKAVTNQDLVSSIFEALGPEGKAEQKNQAKANIRRYLEQVIEKHPISSSFNILVLYDETRMVKTDADNIYSAVTGFKDKKPLLLVLHSDGGFIGAAYLIGKLLREYSTGTLDIAIPRRAKSGATLLCCAGDHLHMGSLSELGPIDPQFEGLPALGLKGAIQHIAELVKEYPHATQLFSQYLSKCVQPIHLGYYERVAESAVQYAERLLQLHRADLVETPAKIAKDLVYSYKDHGFVIDVQEARAIFGDKIVRHNTDEYRLANSLYQSLVFVSRIADAVDHDFNLIGSLASEPGFLKRRK
jgi:hypothetical protein